MNARRNGRFINGFGWIRARKKSCIDSEPTILSSDVAIVSL